MDEKKLLERLERVITKDPARSPGKMIEFVRYLMKKKEASYKEVSAKLWPVPIAEGTSARQQDRRNNIQKLRRDVNERVLHGGLAFMFHIRSNGNRLSILFDPQEIYSEVLKECKGQKFKGIDNSKEKANRKGERKNDIEKRFSAFKIKRPALEYLDAVIRELNPLRLYGLPFSVSLRSMHIPLQVVRNLRSDAKGSSFGYSESEDDVIKAYSLRRLNKDTLIETVDFDNLKSTSSRIMVLGDPGMGKTTLLKWEALCLAQDQKKMLQNPESTIEDITLPVYLTFPDLANMERVIEEIPAKVALRFGIREKPFKDTIRKKLESGRCALYLDAFDEVHFERRKDLTEMLYRFTRSFNGLIIFTSRTLGYIKNSIGYCEEVEIAPFGDTQIRKFVIEWYKNAVEQNVSLGSKEILLNRIRNEPQIRGLCQVPLLLSLACALSNNPNTEFPLRKHEIYEKALDYMITEWSQKKHPQPKLRAKMKLKLLSQAAFSLSNKGLEIFTEEELLDTFEVFGEETTRSLKLTPWELLYELSEYDGIFQLVDRTDKRYMFAHKTFQEFLTASSLKRTIEHDFTNGMRMAEEHFFDYEWHEILALWVQMSDDPIRLLKCILQNPDDIFSTLLVLAGRCISNLDDDYHSLIDQVIDRIYGLWVSSPRDYWFLRGILVMAGRRHRKTCYRLGSSKNEYNRLEEVIGVLGEIGTETALNTLCTILNYHKHCTTVIWAISRCVCPGLEEVLADIAAEGSGEQKEVAVYSLARISGPGPLVNRLVAELLGDPRPGFRVTGVYALKYLRTEEAADYVLRALEDCGLVSAAAVSVISDIVPNKMIPRIIEMLDNPKEYVRCHAACALALLGASQAVNPLIKILLSKDNFQKGNLTIDARQYAALSLGIIGSSDAIDPLIKVLQGCPSDYVRTMAAEALGDICSPKVIRPLALALNDENEDVRGHAAHSLGNVARTLSKTDYLSDESRELAARALEVKVMEEKSPDTKGKMVEALVRVDLTHSVAILKRILLDESECDSTRIKAAFELGRVHFAISAEVLRKLVLRKDTHIVDRVEAIFALGELADQESIPSLLEWLVRLLETGSEVIPETCSILSRVADVCTLKFLVTNPEIDICNPHIFVLARSLAVRFAGEKSPFLPLFPGTVEKYKRRR